MLFCLLTKLAGWCGDDFGAWQTVSIKWLDTERVDLALTGQLRYRANAHELAGYLLSQKVTYQAHTNLDLAFACTWLPSKNSTGIWLDQHRFGPETTLHRSLSENWSVSLRNRLEVRFIEDTPFNERSRHRMEVQRPVHGLGPLTAVYSNDEAIYDYHDWQLNQNRIVPAGFRFHLHKGADLDLYYMIFQAKSGATTSDWNNTHLIDTQLSLSF